jgi:hypothetical protein
MRLLTNGGESSHSFDVAPPPVFPVRVLDFS